MTHPLPIEPDRLPTLTNGYACPDPMVRILELVAENERLRIERDDARQAVARQVETIGRMRGEYAVLADNAAKVVEQQRPLERRIRDLEAERNMHARTIRRLEDADGSGLLRMRRQRDEMREQLSEILRGDAGEDCLECLGDGCHDCIDGRIAR